MSWLDKERILVPVDFSEESIRAVDVALDIGGKASRLHIVHALPDLTIIEPSVSWEALNFDARTDAVEKTLQETFQASKYEGAQLRVLVGDAGHAITDYAEQNNIELIVMPSHGRTGIKRLLIGSVAERVVRYAHCPVLVLRD